MVDEFTLPKWTEKYKDDCLDDPPEGAVSAEQMAETTGQNRETLAHRFYDEYKSGKLERFKVRKENGHFQYYYRPKEVKGE